MLKQLNPLFRYVFALAIGFFLFLSPMAHASHIVGADLFYTYVSGNTYKITFVAYGDCGPASATSFSLLRTATPLICIYNGSTYITSINLSVDSPSNGREITPVCPSDTNRTQCTNTSYTIPGIKKFSYSATYTLSGTSHNWKFSFTGSMGGTSFAGRAAAITNIASGTDIELTAKLDNTYHNNSSPALTIVPTPFFCLNEPDSYNPGAIDADHDSLNFSLVTGRAGSNDCTTPGTNVVYTGGRTAVNPLVVATGSLTFNNNTGQINFTPNTTQRALVVYNVDEYRNDTFIGSSQREMTFLVLSCTGTPPSGGIVGSSGSGSATDSTHYSICQNSGTFSLSIAASEADTTNKIFVSITGSLPTGATFTTVNDSTNHPVSTFRWNTTGVAPGTYVFTVTYKDNACPLYGIRNVPIYIVINPTPSVDAGANVSICAGSNTTLTAIGASTYVWSPSTGLSCVACASAIASPSSTTLYSVTGTSSAGCVAADTVRVTVNPLPSSISGYTAVCVGSTTTLSSSPSGGTWSSSSTSIATVNASTGVVTGVSPGAVDITYTLPTGCQRVISFTVYPLPAAITGPTNVCVGSTITLVETSTGGTWSSGNMSVARVTSGGIVSGLSAGTAVITYTLPTSCYTIFTVTVSPVPSAITGPTEVCEGSSITLSDSISGGIWTSGITSIASINDITGILTGNSSGTVTITYTLPGGCFVTYDITVNPIPSAIIGTYAICAGDSTYVWDGTAGGTWSSSTPAVATIDSLGDIWGRTAGTTTLSYTLPTGCYVTQVFTVNPVPSVIRGPDSVCAGSTITLANSVSGGTWYSSTSSVATVGATTGIVTGVAAGTTTISYGFVATGCIRTKSILVNPLPLAAVISGPTSVCVGSSISLTSTLTTGRWIATNSNATVDSSGRVTGVTAGIDTIKYINTNNCGVATTNYYVTINPLPNAGAISGPTQVCVNATITLTETVSGGVWSSANTAIATVTTSGVVRGVSAGSVLISYAFTNVCGTAYTSHSVDVLALPTISITPSTVSYCAGDSASLTASGGTRYTWTPGTGLSSTAGSNVIAHPTTSTLYIVTGYGTNGCFDTASRMVVVHPIPVITVANQTICDGSSATLTAAGASTYSWTPAATLSTSVGTSVTATPTVTTVYSITGTDIYGCVGQTTVRVTVNPIPAAPTVVTPIKYCLGETATSLSATGVNHIWYSTAITGGSTTATPIPSTAAVGTTTYYVTQTVAGCESPRATITVTVQPNAIADFNFEIRYGCTFDTVTFANLSSYSYRYVWTFGDGTRDTTDVNPTHIYPAASAATDYNVQLVAYNTVCYPDSITKVLTLIPDPTPDFQLVNVSPNVTINYGGSTQLNAEGGITYAWTPANGSLDNPTINNPIATPSVTTTYEVISFNDKGCFDSAFVTVFVNFVDSDFVPTGFTPNDDGLNDFFKILHLRFDKLVFMKLYNRWGEEVFMTTSISEGWNGKYHGEPQDVGVYHYLIKVEHANGETQIFKGNFTLIR